MPRLAEPPRAFEATLRPGVQRQETQNQPRAESREPRAESREPRAESREPRAESRERRRKNFRVVQLRVFGGVVLEVNPKETQLLLLFFGGGGCLVGFWQQIKCGKGCVL